MSYASIHPRISIVTPLYNSSSYIEETLNSVCGQTYENWESILINDGSTDDTAQKVAPYLKDRRFRYMEQNNQGIAEARNSGVRAASGCWVCLLDHDDRWVATKLEEQLEFAHRGSCDLVGTDAVVVRPASRALHSQIFDNDLLARLGQSLTNQSIDVFELLIRVNFLCASSVMVRRELFEHLGLFDSSAAPADDYDMWLRCAPHAKIGYLKKPLTEYLVHDRNYSHDLVRMTKMAVYILLKAKKRHIKDKIRVKQLEDAVINQYEFLLERLIKERPHASAACHAILLSVKHGGDLRLLLKALRRRGEHRNILRAANLRIHNLRRKFSDASQPRD